VSALTGLNLGLLKENIKEAVRDRFDRRPPPLIGAGRLKVRDRLRQMLEEDQQREAARRQHRLLKLEQFDRLCSEAGGVSNSRALLDFLHHNGVLFYRPGLFGDRIGSLREPASWISDTQRVDVGFFPDEPRMVGFLGKIDRMFFLLAGSSGHIIGSPPEDASVGFGFSFLPRLMKYIRRATENSNYDLNGESDASTASLMGEGFTEEDYWHKLSKNRPDFQGSRMSIEFLARRLLVSTNKTTNITVFVGAPLYVALCGEE
jgi:hypothetical protein